MPRIAGVIIPDNKKIEYALPYIYGVGLSLARLILKTAGVDFNKNSKDLTAQEINKIQTIIDKNFKIEGDLRREISENIRHSRDLGTWKGSRHIRKLPIHGRTKTNSRTTRGNVRKTMGSGKKPAAAPK